MNEIEQKFYKAICERYGNVSGGGDISKNPESAKLFSIECQVPIGIYIADFVFNSCIQDIMIVVEIDGHEFHRTKEQRFNDYRRERFLQKEGYIVVRFTGSEVFVDSEYCLIQIEEIINKAVDIVSDHADHIFEIKTYLNSSVGG